MTWIGKVVNQGIVVLGNKGATDQHSYVQQLRDGLNNFFVTFIEVLKDGGGQALMVEPKVSSGDYLAWVLSWEPGRLWPKMAGNPSPSPLKEVSPFSRRNFNRPVRAGCWVLCLARQHQCLPPTRSGGRQESRRQSHSNSMQILEFLSKQSRQGLHSRRNSQGIEAGDESEHVL